MTLLSKNDLVHPFAVSVFEKAQAQRNTGITIRQSRYLKKAMSFDIRHLCDVLSPDYLLPMVSERAQAKAIDLGVDLHKADWHDQPKFDAGRRVFHLEHYKPVGEIRELCMRAASPGDVAEILASELCLAWILKEEDQILRQLGFNSKRPDPAAAYRAAGIFLIQ